MGWPVSWLKEMIDAEAFDLWCRYHERFPLDDQSNHHYPVAALEATLINVNRAPNTPSASMSDRLLFAQRKERHIDEVLADNDAW
jgi:hypothetical protein